jgi:hypothetical protein
MFQKDTAKEQYVVNVLDKELYKEEGNIIYDMIKLDENVYFIKTFFNAEGVFLYIIDVLKNDGLYRLKIISENESNDDMIYRILLNYYILNYK